MTFQEYLRQRDSEMYENWLRKLAVAGSMAFAAAGGGDAAAKLAGVQIPKQVVSGDEAQHLLQQRRKKINHLRSLRRSPA